VDVIAAPPPSPPSEESEDASARQDERKSGNPADQEKLITLCVEETHKDQQRCGKNSS
jgi:hypothetical protein